MSDNKSILYVDDEQTNLLLFEINFKKKFDVFLAESGEKGMEVLKEQNEIEVVISDMKMPGMNGIEFIKMAKKKFPHIRFYILTGFDITEEIADALNEKLILKYFRKPFKMNEIESTIMEIL